MTDLAKHERARRRPDVLSEDATSRAIREIEAEHLVYVRADRPEAGIWNRWEAIVGICALAAAVLIAALLY